MNPLGDENGILILFGLQALLVLLAAYRTRLSRYSIIVGTALSLALVILLYIVLAIVNLLTHGTSGYRFATWLIYAVVGGLLPVAAVGLVEGFVASVIFRLLR